MTSQVTNRREGGSASCRGGSWKLPTYTQKELETAWAAPEPEMYKNGEKSGGFAHMLANNSPKTPFFAKKYLTRYTCLGLLEALL